MPIENDYIFTFCHGQSNGGKCVRICGTYASAREKMFSLFGQNWGFQYLAKDWYANKNFPHEEEISIEEALKNAEIH